MPKIFYTQPFLLIVLLTILLSGCQTAPEKWSSKLGLSHNIVRTSHFAHRVFINGRPNAGYLHIYLGGDGRPWLGGRQISADPTSRNPVALKMAAVDPNAAVYVARPCYFDTASDDRCGSEFWTFGRYSPAVVASMADAIHQVAIEMGSSKIVLFGYSGGGVLATLVAESLPEAAALVTIAANLDVEAWSRLHNYLPLSNSLNPQEIANIPDSVVQIHLYGGLDTNVPPEITRSFISRHGGRGWEHPEFDHRCCWIEAWPQILQRVNRATQFPEQSADR